MMLWALWACSESGISGIGGPSVAVTYGDFDDLTPSLARLEAEAVVFDGLISTATWSDDPVEGFPVEELFTARELPWHDAVFVTSGTRGLGEQVYNRNAPDDAFLQPAVLEAVKSYVQGGGTLLLTDWSYDLAERIWPDAITFFGDDARADDAQRGEVAEILGEVVDPELAGLLGMDHLLLDYNFSNWAVIESVGPGTEVLLRGDVSAWDGSQIVPLQAVPLLVRFHPADTAGTVIVMTFHGNAQTPAVTDTLLAALAGPLPTQRRR